MPKTLDTKLSMFLDKAITEKSLNTKQITKAMGFKHSSKVSQWRRGLVCPRKENLAMIAKVLDLDIEELTREWMAQKYPDRVKYLNGVTATKIKVRLLLHFYEGTKFLGQTLPQIEVNDFTDLEHAVIETYPGTRINLQGISTKTSSTLVVARLPSLKEGYSHETVVKVMQVIVLPS